MLYARQASGTSGGSGPTIIVGPCLDADGAEYTSLAIGELTLAKNGSAAALAANATLTHTANGFYSLVMIGNNVDTVGRAQIYCNKSGYQIPPVEITVLEEAIYDALLASGATGLLPANVTHFGGDAGTFASGVPAVNATHIGSTAQTGRDIGASVLLASGTGAGQISLSSGTVTVGTNNDKTGYGLADGAITAAKIAEDALTAAKFATDFFAAIASAVWGAAARTLTAFSFTPSLHSDYDAAKTAAQPGDEMDLVDAPNETAIEAFCTALEAAILDEGDATALLAAIAAKVEEFINNDGDSAATLQAIATAIRSELATELAHIDADISSRAEPGDEMDIVDAPNATAIAAIQDGLSTHSAADVVDALGDGSALTEAGGDGDHLTALASASALTTVGDNVSAVKTQTDKLDFTGTGGALKSESTNMRGTDGAYTGTPPTVQEIRAEIDANSTKLAGIETEVNKIPRAGETHKWENTVSGESETVEIEEVE